MKRVLLFVFGGLACLVAVGLMIGGSALAIVFRGDGWLDSSTKRVDTVGHALVSEPAEIEAESPWDDGLFDIRIRLRVAAARGGEPLFVGIAETTDVERYLAGVAHDVVTDLQWGRSGVVTDPVPGREVPGLPLEQDFWVASAAGRGEQVLDWEVRAGSYELVIMNLDGSAGVDVRGRFGVRVPFAFPLGIGLLVAGVVLAGVGVLLLVLGFRTGPATASAPPPTPWTGGAPPAPGAPDAAAVPSAPWSAPEGQRS